MKLIKSISPKNTYHPFIFRETSQRVYSFEGFIIYGLNHYHECAEIVNGKDFAAWLKALNLKNEYETLMQIQGKEVSDLQKLLLFFKTVAFIDNNSLKKLEDKIKIWDELPIQEQLKKRGDLFFGEKQYDLALKLYKRAQQEEFNPVIEHNIGITYMKLHFFNEAEIALNKSLMYNDSVEIHLNLLRLYKIAGRYDKAVGYAYELYKRYESWKILFELGNVYELKQQYENALKIYLEAYDLNNNDRILIKIILVILKLKKLNLDINSKLLMPDSFNSTDSEELKLDANPNPVYIYLEALKDKNLALYYILKAKIMEAEGSIKQAIEVLEEGLKILIDDKNITLELAKLCRNNKKIIQSIQAISKVYSDDTADEEILFEVAMIAKKAGNRQDYSNKLDELISYWKTLIRGSFN